MRPPKKPSARSPHTSPAAPSTTTSSTSRFAKPETILFHDGHIYDRMIANDRASDPLSLLGSLGMALVSPVGSEYTPNNLIEFINQAGFMDLYQQNLAATDTLVVAKK